MDFPSTASPGDPRFSPIDFEHELNPDQYAAVTSPDGPALVLAGAGSGKTRTLTYRVAYLLTQGVRPWEILLLTFTNKAAREMLSRVEELTGIEPHRFWGGTFHSIGARLLRMHGEPVGLGKNFTILDQTDAESLLSSVIRQMDDAFLKDKDHPKAKVVADIISYARNTRRTLADVIVNRYPWFEAIREQLETFAKAYAAQKQKQQVADYDDLLELWLRLMEENENVRQNLQQRFRHILVDEYQDTNRLQSAIIDLIADRHQIMAVGDDAQCIYTWRGADFENIVSFPERHPGTLIHKIEINYRSTPEILRFANSILVNQPSHEGYQKELRAVRSPNQRPYVAPAMDTHQQAGFIMRRIHALVNDEGYDYRSIAVLYRAHYQAMDLQMELSRHGLPYTITSGVRFFEQAHIRDLVAQLRFLANPRDQVALTRVACLLPKVGPKTAERLLNLAEKAAKKDQCTLIQALTHASVAEKAPREAKESWVDMALTLQNMEEAFGPATPSTATTGKTTQKDLFGATETTAHQENVVRASPAEIVQIAIDGWYGDYLRNLYPNWEQRHDDLLSLVGFAGQYQDMTELLAQLVLLNSETSDRSIDTQQNSIRLTTIHQAKGLEFPVVFVIGLAEGLFPLKRAIEEGNVEEERRLFYVAVTRAQDELYLLYPRITTQGGPPTMLQPSRFIQEIGPDDYEIVRQSSPTY